VKVTMRCKAIQNPVITMKTILTNSDTESYDREQHQSKSIRLFTK